MLADYLGVDQVLWFAGGIAGNDADGYVDDVTRFVAPQLIVAVFENDPYVANYAILQENLRRLKTLRGPDGKHFKIRTTDSASVSGSRTGAAGQLCQLLHGKRADLVPAFDHTHDEQACGVLRELLPARKVIPIDYSDIAVRLGAIHGLTQQVSAICPLETGRPVCYACALLSSFSIWVNTHETSDCWCRIP